MVDVGAEPYYEPLTHRLQVHYLTIGENNTGGKNYRRLRKYGPRCRQLLCLHARGSSVRVCAPLAFFFEKPVKYILHKLVKFYTKSYKDPIKENETKTQSLQDQDPPC